ncbi:MAG: peptide chain release factor N(5)-glutamine methyltransferase [Polaromonas sp.]|nr:peptide chain release factor N(5)-glutamine methyltransferase [Polaromonas sp.]
MPPSANPASVAPVAVKAALHAAQAAGLDRLDAQMLLLHALGRPTGERAWLMSHDGDLLTDRQAAAFQSALSRRQQGEPLAYIVGRKEFFGLNLQVDARVLVPRPDTETLVQWALDVLSQSGAAGAVSVLDLGTGSGAIALAVHAQQQAGAPVHMTAVDASADALVVAQQNAVNLGLDVQFVHSNWFEKVSGHFHLILSNPPYVADDDSHLAALRHEPLQALTSGRDGLDDLRRIVDDAPAHLHPGGWLLLEHGYDQPAAVRDLLTRRGFTCVESRHDLAGIGRCSGGQWPG